MSGLTPNGDTIWENVRMSGLTPNGDFIWENVRMSGLTPNLTRINFKLIMVVEYKWVLHMDPISRIAKMLKIDSESPQQDQSESEPDFEKRRQLAKKVVNAIASDQRKTLNITNTTEFTVVIPTNQSIFDLSAAVTRYGNVRLPPLYFIDPAQVPFNGPDDETLDDTEKLQKFANKLANLCQIDEKPVTWQDRMYLRMYLDATKGKNASPEKAKNAIFFIIAHEIGHVHSHHAERRLKTNKKLSERKYTLINLVTFGIFKNIAKSLQSRKHEKEADAIAFNMSDDSAHGGIHLFETVHNFKPVGVTEKAAYALLNFSDFFTHGTYKGRKERIEAHLLHPVPPKPNG